ncbi:MAG: hypothetical protein ISN28_09055 [Ectothiorhodospiraceae bacterium AqS1]|nr:hypothetical protein [Ectothiorhodospiraceae bacterium AqS1]
MDRHPSAFGGLRAMPSVKGQVSLVVPKRPARQVQGLQDVFGVGRFIRDYGALPDARS